MNSFKEEIIMHEAVRVTMPHLYSDHWHKYVSLQEFRRTVQDTVWNRVRINILNRIHEISKR